MRLQMHTRLQHESSCFYFVRFVHAHTLSMIGYSILLHLSIGFYHLKQAFIQSIRHADVLSLVRLTAFFRARKRVGKIALPGPFKAYRTVRLLIILFYITF